MRRGELIVNLAFLFFPLVIALFIVAATSLAPIRVPGILVCFALYAVGLGLLIGAKMSLLREGIWLSFDPVQMSRVNQIRYRVAYALLVTGIVINLQQIRDTILVLTRVRGQ